MDVICERCGAQIAGSSCDLCGDTQFTSAPKSVAPETGTGDGATPPPVAPSFARARPPNTVLPQPPLVGVTSGQPPRRRRGPVLGAAVGVAVALVAAIGWQVQARSTGPSPIGSGTRATAAGPSAAPADDDQQSMPTCDVSGVTIAASRTATDGIDSAQRRIGYAAENLVDGDPSTAWRAPGTGVGETIYLDFPQPCRLSGVRLLNGYQKTDPIDNTDRWKQNRRVSKIEIRTGAGAIVADLDVSTKRWQLVGVGASGVSQMSLQILGSAPAKPARDYIAISEIQTV